MSIRRPLAMFMFHRRRSLIVKLLLVVPITFIIISTIITLNEKADFDDVKVEDEQPVIVEPINTVDAGDTYEGRKPRQSAEDQQLQPHPQETSVVKSHDVHPDSHQDLAVLPVPGAMDRPGEMGKPVVLTNLTEDQKKLITDGWERNAFNQYISDLISLHRKLPDVRTKGCQDVVYEHDLPKTSVIICFHNEAWSVLVRTIHSVLDRSPPHLLEDVILVDDFSDIPHVGKPLEEYFAYQPKVKFVRAKRREGLIRARLMGASAASAPVLTYLDSHCECAHGWLEPLLQRIANNWTTVVCPVIDVIDDDTFQYHYRESGEVNVGGFDWNLQFNWHAMPERESQRRAHHYDPIWSPTMAGGLFSISKKFFEHLGTYDSGFDIWGGENLELSFKTWMCGGSLEIIPCSHVGHVFRKRSPYKWKTGVNVLRKNSVRLAEVWLDDYKRYYYDRIGNDLGEYGDVTMRKELRNRLKCKSFGWYLSTIYPELFVPGEALAQGEIRNMGLSGDTCLDSAAKKDDMHKPIGLWPCHGQGGNQYWMLSKEGEIRRDEACLDYAGSDIILYPCHGSGGNQMWQYDPTGQSLRHSSSRKCMELAVDKESVFMADCNANEKQRWYFQGYDPSKIKDNALS